MKPSRAVVDPVLSWHNVPRARIRSSFFWTATPSTPAQFASLLAAALLAACTPSDDPQNLPGVDATAYFPVALGNYWVLFDAEDRFLTLEFTHATQVSGKDALVLSFTLDFDTTTGEPIGPVYELTLAQEDKGILVYGWRDATTGQAITFLPGGLLASPSMQLDVPIETETAANGALTAYTSTLLGTGTIQTYFGDFPEGIKLQAGAEAEMPLTWFLALDRGPVKLDWQESRFQLYDFGTR